MYIVMNDILSVLLMDPDDARAMHTKNALHRARLFLQNSVIAYFVQFDQVVNVLPVGVSQWIL